jgi:hypothetical protein
MQDDTFEVTVRVFLGGDLDLLIDLTLSLYSLSIDFFMSASRLFVYSF